MPRLGRRSPGKLGPPQLVVIAFAVLIAIGTVLLWLPVSSAPGTSTTPLTALFTATSAVTVTGLVVVDTATHWSLFGKVVIGLLVQVGGFGIMTLASVLALLVSHRLGIRYRVLAQVETGPVGLGEIRRLVRLVAQITVVVEVVVAAVLTARFLAVTDLGVASSIGYGVFHSVSAFNNAGFALFSDSLVGFVDDWVVIPAVAMAVIIGGIGFPVLLDLRDDRWSWRRWSLHTKLTLATTAVLLVVGSVALLVLEWRNAATLGPLDTLDKVLAGTFHAVMPRTAGFNSLDVAGFDGSSLLITDALMFIGGGSASTAGGIKVTTFALLGYVIWAELRGEPNVVVMRREVSTQQQRQALTIALLAVGVVMAGAIALVESSGLVLTDALFESISAFATVGLSTGVTADLEPVGRVALMVLMFVGRVGPATAGTAIILARQKRRYSLPKEGMLVG